MTRRNIPAPKGETPTADQASGVSGEQISFLPTPPLSPSMPSAYSKAWLALLDLTQGPLTQIDWLNMGRGWRLSAAFKELGYLGWPLDSEWVQAETWPQPIKRYWLKPEGLTLAIEWLRGAHAQQH